MSMEIQHSSSPIPPVRQFVFWRRWVPLLMSAGLLGGWDDAMAQGARVVLTPAPGYTLTWNGNNGGYSSAESGARAPLNAASAENGVFPFASSSFAPGGIHDAININDGFYGNSSSWIADFAADPPDLERFVGVAFPQSVAVSSVAWGRDNGDAVETSCGGTCMDRAVGSYVIQITRAASPTEVGEGDDAATGWITVGTVQYLPGADGLSFSAYLRHRFEVGQDGNPIPATGLRLKVSDAGMAIDELEVNPPADPVPPISDFIVVKASPGFELTWDLNDGSFSRPDSPAVTPRNRALASEGTSAFASSEFTAGNHFATNVIDGRYGNTWGWIPDFTLPDPDPYIGLRFGGNIPLRNVAWSRDNGDATDCCGGELTDRALGVYTIQVTRVASPGPDTLETGDAATGWVTVGQIDYKSSGLPFRAHLRHRFDMATAGGAPVIASGLRLKVPTAGTAIDEVEVNARLALETDLTGNLVLTPAAGYTIAWDGNDGDFFGAPAGARAPEHDGLESRGARAFGSSELDFGTHYIRNVADGRYGNSSSWISLGAAGSDVDPAPFIGIAFASRIDVRVIAFGRDNGDTVESACGGTCMDRALGLYTFQVTTVGNPGVDTIETGDPATGWVTVGSVEYLAAKVPAFNPSFRHAFDLAQDGQPIPATALRILVSNPAIAIDEIEVNPRSTVAVPPLSDLLAVRPASGFSMEWDGTDGAFSSPETNAPARANAGLVARGGVAFGSSELDAGVHFIRNINDGIYGNAHSWVPASNDPTPSVGIRLPELTRLRSIAWSRDNGDATDCCGGTLTDRALGTYTVQVTWVEDAGSGTPETGDPSTGWQTIGEVEYRAAYAEVFNPHLRHAFRVAGSDAPLFASAVRIKASTGGVAIDELELNPDPVVDPAVLGLSPAVGFEIFWDGNDGDYFTMASPAPAPPNDALAAEGASAIGSSELGLGVHLISHVNDGLYGNSKSWIADFINGDGDPWIGVAFGRTVLVSTVAWGRDNGDVAGDCCGGNLTDRAGGMYAVEYTQVELPGLGTEETGDPSTGWTAIGQVEYRGTGNAGFRQHLRHEFKVSLEGEPVPATAIRLRVPNSNTAIDEIEVNTQHPVPVIGERLEFSRVGLVSGKLEFEWAGGARLETVGALGGTWTEVIGATSPFRVEVSSGDQSYYRLRR